MTKRVMAVILSALMMLTMFASCNGSDNSTSSNASSAGSSSAASSAGESSNANSSETSSASEVKDPTLGGEDNIELTVWGPSAQQDILKSQVDAFKALYPDKSITINVGVSEENNARTEVLNDISAAADVFSFPSDHLQKLVDAGALSPVVNYADITDNNIESSVKAATLSDTLYAYPLTADNTYVMFYDKSVFGDSVTSLNDMCQKAKDAGKAVYFNAGDGFYACSLSFTGGMSIEHDYKEDTEKHSFSDGEEGCAKTLAAFGELFKEGGLKAASTTEGVSAFSSGKAAALVDGTWDATSIKDALGDNMGVVALPSITVDGTEKPMVSLFGYKLMGVKKNTKYPNAAHALAEYLSGEKCQSEKAEKLSICPSNENAANSDVVTSNPITKAVADQVAHSIPQLSIASGFWNAHAAVGNYLADGNKDLSVDALKKLIADCMESTNEG